VYVASVDGGPRQLVIRDAPAAIYADPGYLLFGSGRTLMAVPFDPKTRHSTGEAFQITEDIDAGEVAGRNLPFASASGMIAYRRGMASADFVWFDRHGTRQGTVKVPEGADSFDLSPNDDRLALRAPSSQSGLYDIWTVDLGHNTPQKITSVAGYYDSPTWSHDANRLAYNARPSGEGGQSIYEQEVSGLHPPKPILAPQPSFGAISRLWGWSPDDRFLVFLTTSQGAPQDLWAVPVDGDHKPFPVVQQQGTQVQAQVSPDSHWLAYTSNENGPRDFEIWIQDFPVFTQRQRISIDGGDQPHWQRNLKGDSQKLFYLLENGMLVEMPVRLGKTIEPGKPTNLFMTHPPGGAWAVTRRQFEPSSDGQRFLVRTARDAAAPAPYIVTVNWAAGIGK
jgi:hypothetical protein